MIKQLGDDICKGNRQGRSQTFSSEGATGGASFATRELSMVCVGLSERDLNSFGGPLGGPGKIFGRKWHPWHPPSSAPGNRRIVPSSVPILVFTNRYNDSLHAFLWNFSTH